MSRSTGAVLVRGWHVALVPSEPMSADSLPLFPWGQLLLVLHSVIKAVWLWVVSCSTEEPLCHSLFLSPNQWLYFLLAPAKLKKLAEVFELLNSLQVCGCAILETASLRSTSGLPFTLNSVFPYINKLPTQEGICTAKLLHCVTIIYPTRLPLLKARHKQIFFLSLPQFIVKASCHVIS